MRDLVSTRWVRVAGLVVAVALAGVVVPSALPWILATWATLIVGTIALLRGRPGLSMREMIDAGERGRQPLPVVVRPRQRPR